MPKIYEMPRMSDTMEEGVLIKWNVKVGDKVKSGDEVADIETDKATMPMPVYDDGVVAKLVAQAGQTLKVGQTILILAVGGESIEDAANATATKEPAGTTPKAEAAAAPAAAVKEAAPGAATTTETGRLRASPLAKKIADDKGIDLAAIVGSGPQGRIIKSDVLTAASKPATPPPAPTPGATPSTGPAPALVPKLESKVVPVSNMRKTIARRLVESKTTIPHFTVTISINMDPLASVRTTLNEYLAGQGVKLSVNDFIVRAAAMAMARHPVVNSSWTNEGIDQHGSVNIGVAVSLPAEKGGGLVVPTLRDVLNKGLIAISAETKALADKARGPKGLTIEEMSDGTFTISNLGMFGVDHFEAIINPPQAAILAIGAAISKPVVRNGQIVVGTEMAVTISADHRVIDGAMAAEYLQTFKKLLENPSVLLV